MRLLIVTMILIRCTLAEAADLPPGAPPGADPACDRLNSLMNLYALTGQLKAALPTHYRVAKQAGLKDILASLEKAMNMGVSALGKACSAGAKAAGQKGVWADFTGEGQCVEYRAAEILNNTVADKLLPILTTETSAAATYKQGLQKLQPIHADRLKALAASQAQNKLADSDLNALASEFKALYPALDDKDTSYPSESADAKLPLGIVYTHFFDSIAYERLRQAGYAQAGVDAEKPYRDCNNRRIEEYNSKH